MMEHCITARDYRFWRQSWPYIFRIGKENVEDSFKADIFVNLFVQVILVPQTKNDMVKVIPTIGFI